MSRPIAPAAPLVSAAALLALIVLADPATARAGYSYSGALTTGPTFNRPVDHGDDAPVVLSSSATAVYYSSFGFRVDVDGSYSFLSTADFDNFTLLYGSDFDPTSPLTNVLIGNDDANSTSGLSGFAANLSAGTEYFFVTTSYANGQAGTFANQVDGPGLITPSAVPAPPSLALLALGLPGGVVAARAGRRTRRA